MYKLKIDARINNQITFTKLDLAEKNQARYEQVPHNKLSQEEINSLIVRDATNHGVPVRKRFYEPQTRVIPMLEVQSINRESPVYLDLITKFQEPRALENGDRQKRGYGETPRIRNFPVSAGQSLRESGAAIDLLCAGDTTKCRVITLTLPASGHDAYKCISDYSAYATNRLLQIIRDTKDDDFYYFYCIEHQKRGALHWHICLFHEDKERSRILGEKLVAQWRNILHDIGTKGNVDLLFSKGFGRRIENSEMQSLNQEMYAGCASYFAKYAGKTIVHGNKGSETDINCINAKKYPCSSFWGRSRNLVKLCKANSFHFEYTGLEEEVNWKVEEEIELLSQFNLIQIEEIPFEIKRTIDGIGEICIAKGTRLVAYCKKEDYQHILSHLRFKYRNESSSSILERARKPYDTAEPIAETANF